MSISDDNTSTLSNTDRTDRLQPVFTDGIPIIWNGNDAHLAGILLEVKRFFIRTGQFKNLFAFRAAPVGGKGMLAVSSFSSVPFVLGSLAGPFTYDFDTPSPEGAQRFADYRHEAIRTGTAPSAVPFPPTAIEAADKYTVMLAPHVVDAEDSRLLVSLCYTFGHAEPSEEIIEAANGSGLALKEALTARYTNSSPKDKALVAATHARIVRDGVKGELKLENFKAWVKLYKSTRHNLPSATRPPAEAEAQMISTIAESDPATRDLWELKCAAAMPTTFDGAVTLLSTILRGRVRSDQIDQVMNGAQGIAAVAAKPPPPVFDLSKCGDASDDDGAGLGRAFAAALGFEGNLTTEHATNLAAVAKKAIADPNFGRSKKPGGPNKKPGGGKPPLDIPRGADGKPLRWIEGMALCKCGIGGGKHLFKDCTVDGKPPSGAAPGGAPAGSSLVASGGDEADLRATLAALLGSIVPPMTVGDAGQAGSEGPAGSNQSESYSLSTPANSHVALCCRGDGSAALPQRASETGGHFVASSIVASSSMPSSPTPISRAEYQALVAPGAAEAASVLASPISASLTLTFADLTRGPSPLAAVTRSVALLVRELSSVAIAAHLDSGCSGSLTPSCKPLINIRPCSERFAAADGGVAIATHIGDMPVRIRDSTGKFHQLTIRNVRCVPDFKFTLLSVQQLWREQQIDTLFADVKSIVVRSSGVRFPFSSHHRLPTIAMVSAVDSRGNMLSIHDDKYAHAVKTAQGATWEPPGTAAAADSAPEPALEAPASSGGGARPLGFHRIGAASHVAKLTAAQAAELLHRRSHLGVDKLRATAHTSVDAPKILASAPADSHAGSCVSCAEARIKKAAHSGSLSAPAPEPGTLHVDLKELILSIGGYRYVVFAIDEFTRYVFVEFIKFKSEVGAAVKRIVAAFDAIVGTRVDEHGQPLARPRVRALHSDREGGLVSASFNEFRAEASLHHTTSPPHDHDLNPIAERVIGLISETATAVRSMTDAKARLWPWLIAYVVDWHNSTIGSVGSSPGEPGITPHQRLTLVPPRVMDLAAFGARAVVLKPPERQHKPSLSTRGEVGAFLGRSRNSKGTYDVLVAGGKIISSSSVLVDEDYFDWAPAAKRHQPLTAASRRHSPAPTPSLHRPADASDRDDTPDLNALCFLDLFSGAYARTDGLKATLKQHGWSTVDQIDSDGEKGGGWDHDLLNDANFAGLLAKAKAGRWHAMHVAFPCSTGSVARLFDASGDGGDRGPPAVRDAARPDGLPESELDPRYVRALRSANLLLARAAALMLAARRSPARTRIAFEQPANRADPSSTAYAPELAAHGSILATTIFRGLVAELGLKSCTFAYCRLDAPHQKYTTLYYTPELGPELDVLDGPEFQCNHERGAHSSHVGGRDSDGAFRSRAAAAYPRKLIVILARAFTRAVSGSHTAPTAPSAAAPASAPPPSAPRAPPAGAAEPSGWWQGMPTAPVSASSAGGASPRAGHPAHDAGGAPPPSAVYGARAPPPTPVPFQPFSPSARSPSAAPPSASPLGPLQASPPPVAPPAAPVRPPRTTYSGTGKPDSPGWNLPGAQARGSEVADLGPRHAGVGRARASERLRPVAEEPVRLDLSSPGGTDTSYSPFAAPVTPAALVASELRGSREASVSFMRAAADERGALDASTLSAAADHMEAFVSQMVLSAAADSSLPNEELLPVSAWADVASAPAKGGRAMPVLVSFALGSSIDRTDPSDVSSLGFALHAALRADSPGAPSTHAEAVAAGKVWMQSEGTELGNHDKNKSWHLVPIDQVPRGRRVHKLIWVYKLKRDGTAKARLCVQGNTLEAGVDYDQVFSAALRYSSARGLFAFAARHGCRVRSVDLVAAYLQGRFVDGEVVYCHLPPGYPAVDEQGRPMIARVEKPIYGIQQAGRRLQRMLFAYLIERGFTPLDDSDSCVFVKTHADGEVLSIGVYVDNLQIVHSVAVGADGRGPEGSAYNELMDSLARDWDVTDEGPMEDLLGIEVDYLSDGAIKLHQTSYVGKLVERFLPHGPVSKAQRGSLPYSANFLRHVADALALPLGSHPELVKSMQERLGSLMYAATSTRPDLAFVVHYLCKCLHKPTPELIRETDYIFSYLARHPSAGLTYTREQTRLSAFADASWETRHSTSGWVVLWQSAALSWGSRQQKSIALSTCEAEIIALSEAAKDVVYLRKFKRGLGDPEPGPSTLATDSQSARDVSYNPQHHDRMKHVERRHFFVRDMVEKFEIEVPFVRTEDNLADFFTKP